MPDEYRGLDRFEARDRVVADIDAEGLMIVVEDKTIMQPFGDRSKVVIEPMLTDQWFVDTDKIVGPALDAVREGHTEIIPQAGEKTYFHWLENIEPWCISRQLWWGHQIPVWYGFDLSAPDFVDDEGDGDLDMVEIGRLLTGGMVHVGHVQHCAPDTDAVESAFRRELQDTPVPISAARIVEVADRAEALETLAQSLADYTTSQDPTHLVYPIWRDPDVLDTWFSSGLWPIGTLGWPEETEELKKYHPTDVLVTGFDILFFWVARMMMMQLAVRGEVPFKTVYLHQLVRDEKGKKMSKTTGNVIDPLEIIDEFGADALRFTNAQMAAVGGVLKLSRDRITGYRNFGTKLWNACRFAEMNGVFDAPRLAMSGKADVTARQTVNRWIIGETARVREEVDDALAGYRFNDAANALYSFVWGKVCDWYLELSKPLLLDGSHADKVETREVMGWVLDQCLILLHPMMPFITEELWGASHDRDRMLVHADWPEYQAADLADPSAEAEMSWTISLIEGIRSARAQMNVPAGLQVPVLKLETNDTADLALSNNEALIRKLARIASIEPSDAAPKGAITVPVAGATFCLPLADIIDVTAEKARLTKAIDKLSKEIGGLEGRLNNPNFAASAPEDIVEEARNNLTARKEEDAKLRDALSRLAEID